MANQENTANRKRLLQLALSGAGDVVRAGISPTQQPTFLPAALERQQASQDASQKLEQLMGIELFKEELRRGRPTELDQLMAMLPQGAGEEGSTQAMPSSNGTAIKGQENIFQDVSKERIVKAFLEKKYGDIFPKSEEERQAEIQQKIDEKKAITKATEKGKVEGKREAVAPLLENYFALDAVVNPYRSQEGGLGDRLEKGIKLKAMQLDQSTMVGSVASVRNNSVKNLRVAVARIQDVGNLSKTEQEAAEILFPSDFDSQMTANLKNAYLRDLTNAVDSEDETAVRKLLNDWMSSDGYKEALENKALQDNVNSPDDIYEFNSFAEADDASEQLPDGAIISVKGELFRNQKKNKGE